MTDIVDKKTRSRMMSGIRGRDTLPERMVRSQLWRAGFRYSLHQRKLPGRPDLVLRKWRVVIFVHGCFWHGHKRCRYFRLPSTRQKFWSTKIDGNSQRDEVALRALAKLGWRTIVVWECAVRDDPAGVGLLLDKAIRGKSALVKVRSSRRRARAIERKLPRGLGEITYK